MINPLTIISFSSSISVTEILRHFPIDLTSIKISLNVIALDDDDNSSISA